MNKKVDVAIIGAGTAGLSAFKEASKYTHNILLIDKGPLGTTCARVGCMPSKVLIHVANQFSGRQHFDKIGIRGADKLSVDIPAVLKHVRKLRDHFTSGVVKFTKSLGEQFICGQASFVAPDVLQVDRQKIVAKKIIIAPGSHSVLPETWQDFHERVLMSENIFEQADLAKTIAVIGGGIIGLELGQALARLGINLTLFHGSAFIGGLTDPEVNATAIKILANEYPIVSNDKANVKQNESTRLSVSTTSSKCQVEQILAAIGRKPNLAQLNLAALDLELNDSSIPVYDNTTMKIKNMPIYIAGDANKSRPLLHEAADEGRIAGFNATHPDDQCFERRVPIRIVFSQPNIIGIGQSFQALSKANCAIGEIDYSNQGRAKVMNHNKGLLRVYGDKNNGKLLGAEGILPDGEHLAHTLAWAIQQQMTVFDILQMPFYHPVIEEGMRTALRDLAKQVKGKSKPFELAMCDSQALPSLS